MNAKPKTRRSLHRVKILRIQLEFLFSSIGVTKLAKKCELDHSTVSRNTTGNGFERDAGDRQLNDLVVQSRRECKFFAEMTLSEFGAFCVALLPPEFQTAVLSKHLKSQLDVLKSPHVPHAGI